MLPEQKYLHQCLRYEPETGKVFWRHRPIHHFTAAHLANRWNSRCAGKEAFAVVTNYGYRQGTLDGQVHLSHRIIWKMVTGQEPDQVDHVNHQRSDNRWSNLRDASQAINQRNQGRSETNKSGCTGVRWHRSRGRWLAQIQIAGRNKHLGYFDNFEAAVLARKTAERRYDFHPNHGQARAA